MSTEQWWTEQAVDALYNAGAWCGVCDREDSEDGCPECVKCLQGYLTALTPHVAAYAAHLHGKAAAIEVPLVRQQAWAEAFEEAKRIVRVQLDANKQVLALLAGSEVEAIRLVWQRIRALENVLAALDRAQQTTQHETEERTDV